MKKSNGIFWGGLLVIVGIFWLLRNLGFLNIDWQEVSRYWPILLILAGGTLLASGRERGGWGGGVAGILIALAVLGGITHRTDRAFNDDRRNWNFDWDSDDDNNDDEWNFGDRKRNRLREENRERSRKYGEDYNRDSEENRERNRKYEEDYNRDKDDADKDDKSEKRDIRNRHYEYEMENGLKEATLNFEGGAGEFKLKGSTTKLFEAESRSSIGGFRSEIRNNRNANTAVIDFKMESGKINLKKGDNANSVEINLNKKPLWNIDMGLGAGEAKFDLSDFRVKSLKVSTGVADLNVKLGDKVNRTDVKIESGVASVTLEIPESVGCEVRIDGMLNDKDMGDLQKVSDGLYRSPGFDRATRKIMVDYEAGLSEVNIRRY
ncbi:LiaI-LiaF-like domain-containing protein [Persicitalea sp.]|uniref:LiaI-LiaF-like domain-containing protein n=1 Tax=Persicitalea sp. TaxID=3100273 RepID=UPI003593A30A